LLGWGLRGGEFLKLIPPVEGGSFTGLDWVRKELDLIWQAALCCEFIYQNCRKVNHWVKALFAYPPKKPVILNRRGRSENLGNRLPYSIHLRWLYNIFVSVGITLYLCYYANKCIGVLRMMYVQI